MGRIVLVVLAVCLAAAAVPVWAAGQDEVKITIDLRSATLAQALAEISKAAGAPVLTDGEIVRSDIQVSVTDAPVDVALSAVCVPQQLGWKRLYVKSAPEAKLKGEDLGNLLRALDAIRDLGLAATDGTTKLSTVYMKGAKLTPEQTAPLTAPDSGYRLVYLIVDLKAKPKAKEQAQESGAKSPVDRLISQDQQNLAVLRSLTPQQIDEYWTRQSEMFRSMDRNMQAGFMAMGMRMFMGMDPEEAQQVFRDAISRLSPEEMDSLRNLGGGPHGPPPGG